MEKIRVSIGSAAVLGLQSLKMNVLPTTIHLLQYSAKGCQANCAFCPQARDSIVDKKMLSRVSWPAFDWKRVKQKLISCYLEKKYVRICLQTVLYKGFIDEMMYLIEDLFSEVKIPLSVALIPISIRHLEKMKEMGVDRIGIALDASTPDVFSKIKGNAIQGPYKWKRHHEALQDALKIFGKGKVSTHLIIGLGESERDAVQKIYALHKDGITVGLFAFMPVEGTILDKKPQPIIKQFRRVQLARHLIVHDKLDPGLFSFDEHGMLTGWHMSNEKLKELIRDNNGSMFMTSGCPGCNRPYYTSSPRGQMYNYPSPLTKDQIEQTIQELFPN